MRLARARRDARRIPLHRARGMRWMVVGRLGVLALFLGGWWLVCATDGVPAARVPSPASVAAAAADLVQQGHLAEQIAVSMTRLAIGLVAGASGGYVLAGVLRRWSSVRVLLGPLTGFLRAVPTVAWMPLLVLALGVGEPAIVVLIAIGGASGVLAPPAEAARHLPVDRPRTAAGMVSGLRRALRRCWVLVLTAEVLGAPVGLGSLLTDAGRSDRVARVLALLIVVAALTTLTDAVIRVGAIPVSSRGTRPARTVS